MSRRRRLPAVPAALTLALLSALGLLVAEAIAATRDRTRPVRIAEPDPAWAACRLRPGTARLWDLDPAHPGVGPDGLRGPPVSSRPAAGVHRIVVLGGSVTFGAGVDPDQAWPRVFARLAGRRARTVEVVDASVPAYGASQMAAAAREVVLPLHPHGLILALGPDDLDPPPMRVRTAEGVKWAWYADVDGPDLLKPLAPRLDSFHRGLWSRSHLYRFAVRAAVRRASRGPLPEGNATTERRALDALGAIATACRDRHVELHAVLVPRLGGDAADAREEVLDRIGLRLDASRVPLTDLRRDPTFADQDAARLRARASDPRLPGADGHARIAAAVLADLDRRRALPKVDEAPAPVHDPPPLAPGGPSAPAPIPRR